MLHEDTKVAGFGLADVRPAAARRAFGAGARQCRANAHSAAARIPDVLHHLMEDRMRVAAASEGRMSGAPQLENQMYYAI
jgi:hypothetical protein